MKNRKLIVRLCAAATISLVAWTVWGNTTVGLTQYVVKETNLPAQFDGYRIAHVSDLHSSWLWKQTIQRLKEAEPDIICITGDLVDSYRTDISSALSFAAEAVRIAPCYFITGNHEAALSYKQYRELETGLCDLGVTVLSDEEVILKLGESTISLSGHSWGPTDRVGELTNFDGYRILLTHDPAPEDFANYAAARYGLVLAGHMHGGQFRLPFIGGLYVPSQGFFPENDAGLCVSGETDMIVSRGIGNSVFPVRFNNQPEIILIELKAE